ncbi:signal peptide peptidase SppA [Bacillus solimangrovi]|uniref:Signal peptide peptidase SppA n=1 Tax=Bacillus solimangrovi TaxID=1305675 RepID=A0A1E5LCK8_9BACI|nr:signal peptide peptidase SppA [Bacillus solimangrovi]OEH91817.1 signal peptide peptidase SppA [Bacillus solimangrovi]
MSKKRWLALGAAIILFLMSTVAGVFTSQTTDQIRGLDNNLFTSEETNFSEKIIKNGTNLGKIVVLDVNGAIVDSGDVESMFTSPQYNHRQFLKMIEKAGEDDSVKGVILRVNSPGGGVAESAEIHHKLTTFKEEHNKPLYVSMGSIAASGGYYIATPADKIFASAETLTGSLGVIMQGMNYSELAEKLGVEIQTVKSGQYKDLLSPYREMSEQEREILQSMVNNSYQGFVNVIAEGRDLTKQEVREIADGRIYDGRQALELNLIDQYGYFDDVVDAMKNDEELGDVKVVQYTDDFSFGSLFSVSANKIIRQNTDLELLQLFTQPNAPRLMYLYTK